MANAEHLKILKEGVEVWNRWRKSALNIKPNLVGANLSKANLGNVNLSMANLSRANLTDSNLMDADLTTVNLGSAYLRNAYMARANLTGANLSAADLNGATLSGAILSAVNLSEANLHNISIGFTVFGLTDLSTCTGLERINVQYSCIIDFHTLRASKNLPKSFLLKLGLPELYIDYLPDFYQNEGIRLYPAFLSHSWTNKPFARKLYEALIAKGVNVFFDEKKIKPGDEMFTALSRGIDHYDKTILVCSEASLSSWWVDHELEMVFDKERALQKEIGEKMGLLIPITIDDHIFKWTDGKRMAIEKRNIGDFRNWEDEGVFEKALNGLMHALNVDRLEVKPVSHLPRKAKS